MEQTASESPIPEGQTVNEYVGELIRGQFDNDEAENTVGGEEVPVDDVRENDSGSGALDTRPDNAPESLEDDAQEPAQDAAEGADDAVTLAKLADHLDLEPAELYDVEIPIADGHTVTLGQLKDEYKAYGPAKEMQEAMQQKSGDFEKQVLQTRSELNSIMQVIPAEMQQQIIQQAKAHQQQWTQQQEKTVLEAIPDWADETKRAESRAQFIEDGAEFGFSEQEITFTQDARTLRWMKEFASMKRELQAMKTAAKAQPGKAGAPGKATRSHSNNSRLSKLLNKARQSTDYRDKVAVASELIRNQQNG